MVVDVVVNKVLNDVLVLVDTSTSVTDMVTVFNGNNTVVLNVVVVL